MDAGQVIAIGFAAASTVTLLATYYMLRRVYTAKMEEAARVLGVGRQIVTQLEKEGRLPGALGLGHPVAIDQKALEVLLECRRQGTTGSQR